MGFDLWAFVELAEGYIPERLRKPARGIASLVLLSSALGLSKVIGQLGHWTAERYQALPPWIFPVLQGLILILAGILFGYFLGRSRNTASKIESPSRTEDSWADLGEVKFERPEGAEWHAVIRGSRSTLSINKVELLNSGYPTCAECGARGEWHQISAISVPVIRCVDCGAEFMVIEDDRMMDLQERMKDIAVRDFKKSHPKARDTR